MCSADQTQCVKCNGITLGTLTQTYLSGNENSFFDYTAEYSPNGSDSKNHFSLTLYNSITYIDFSRQTFDTCTLDKPTNADGVCAFIKEYNGNILSKLYFPQRGVIHISQLNSDGSFKQAAIVGKAPIFVEIDKITGEPVPNGQCYQIKNASIDANGK